MLKAKEVITENILLLKYQKADNSNSIRWENVLMLFCTARENRGRFLFVMLFFIFSRDTSPIENKTPDREFYWSHCTKNEFFH